MATGSYIAGKSRHGPSDKSEGEDSEKGEGAICKDNNKEISEEGKLRKVGELSEVLNNKEISEEINPKNDGEEGELRKVRELREVGEPREVGKLRKVGEFGKVGERIGYEDDSEISKDDGEGFGPKDDGNCKEIREV